MSVFYVQGDLKIWKAKKYIGLLSVILCLVMASISNASAVELTLGHSGKNVTYNSTLHFMIDGTNYESTQSKYSYAAYYYKPGTTYYICKVNI